MNTYKWDCSDVEVYTSYEDSQGNTEPLVIFKVKWKLLVSDEIGNSTTTTGIEELNIENLDNFTSFDDVTNNQVTIWVQSSMGESKVINEKVLADEALESLINPITQMLTLKS